LKSSKILVKVISTFFGAGYFPFIPGTFASVAGVFLFYLVKDNHPLYALLTSVLIITGFLISGMAERAFGKKDAPYIVIDEVCGMLLSLGFLPFYNLKVVIAGFLVFRILDSLKPYPAWQLQDLKGSAGVMADDIIAGIYTNIVLQLALRLASF